MISESIIDEEAWANAPEEPEQAFMALVIAARSRLDLISSGKILKGRFSETQWRRQYITEVYSIGEEFGLDFFGPFGSYLGTTENMDSFDVEVARALTRMRARNRDLLKADSVTLSIATKVSVRQKIEQLRQAINQSNLSAKRKERLHKKVDAVETELERRRSSLTPFWVLAGSISVAFPTTVATVSELPAAIQAVEQIVEMVNGEKSQESPDEILLLEPPPLQITDQSTTDTCEIKAESI